MNAADRAEAVAMIAAEDDLLDRTVLVTGWPHEAPDQPFSGPEAHQAWQGHTPCTLDACARKRAAYRTLVELGEIVPDERADYR